MDELPSSSAERIKETCRLIRLARSNWDAHRNLACKTERQRALTLYNSLSDEEKDEIPQELRVWLRYRSEKYFGTGHGNGAKGNAKIKHGVQKLKGKVAEAETEKLSRRALRWRQNKTEI